MKFKKSKGFFFVVVGVVVVIVGVVCFLTLFLCKNTNRRHIDD